MGECMENLRKSIAENPTDLILLFVTAALYLLNNLILKQNTRGVLREFLICYFNDVMAPMALLAYSNILLGTTGKRLCSIRHIFPFCLCAGFVWEFLAPILKEGSVADPCDMIAYLFGGSVYWIMMLIGSFVRSIR